MIRIVAITNYMKKFCFVIFLKILNIFYLWLFLGSSGMKVSHKYFKDNWVFHIMLDVGSKNFLVDFSMVLESIKQRRLILLMVATIQNLISFCYSRLPLKLRRYLSLYSVEFSLIMLAFLLSISFFIKTYHSNMSRI